MKLMAAVAVALVLDVTGAMMAAWRGSPAATSAARSVCRPVSSPRSASRTRFSGRQDSAVKSAVQRRAPRPQGRLPLVEKPALAN
ncbi:MAG TPA: hypothetical protein VHQ90_23340 [Thermoanaerobaculia bacterium]|nr:hypothetical protein [Thermoanaerobaculia bacterium]